MGRKKKITKKIDNLFTFRGAKGCYYPGPFTVDFTSDKSKSNIPVFNNDQMYFTPAFIIPSLYSGNTADYHQNHKKKIYTHQQISRENILMPKPKSKNKICSVCREPWEDYQTHVTSEEHKIKLRRNKFYQHIFELIEKYERIKGERGTSDKEREKEKGEKEMQLTVDAEEQKNSKQNEIKI